MKQYEELKHRFASGWNTWNTYSMTGHVLLPDGFSVSLGVKEFDRGHYKAHFLVDDLEKGTATPHAHAYDASYTSLSIDWKSVHFTVETAADGDSLVMLITPDCTGIRPAQLIIRGESLWNHNNIIKKTGDHLTCTTESGKQLGIYATGEQVDQVFTDAAAPYLSVLLTKDIAISVEKERSLEEVRALIASGKKKWEENKERYGKNAELYNAMQTCLAWDTVYDPEAETAFSTVSRNWNVDWGGYVLFCWDTYFAAAMAGTDNKDLAYLNAIEITLHHTPNGFVPNFAAATHMDSFDRSQPPVGSRTVLDLYRKYQEPWLVEFLYPHLKTWNQWFYDHRQTSNGLFAWGSDPYKEPNGEWSTCWDPANLQGAMYESGLDNSPMYDDVPYSEETHCMQLEDVGLSALLIEDNRCLAALAEILGKKDDVAHFTARKEALEEKLEDLWDDSVGIYCNRRTDTGEFSHRLSPTNFYALFSEKVLDAHKKRMIAEHFYNPNEFFGEYIMPSIARCDPAFPDQIYWRGRIWAPMNFLVYQAFETAGLTKEMAVLAEKSANLILKEWLECGHVHENYCPDTGMGCNSPRSDKYYHWGALLGYIQLLQDGQTTK